MKFIRQFGGIVLGMILVMVLVACGAAANPGNVANSEGESAAADVALAVAEGTLDTDANGLTVGFTAEGRPFRGDPAAPVVIEEFSDYQCPYCARFFQETLPSIEQNQIAGGETVLVFYDFPLESIHPQAAIAAVAARCAGDQGAAAYWNMHDTLFTRFGEWGNDNAASIFLNYAGTIGLDVDVYAQCLSSGTKEPLVRADMDLGIARGVTGTPGFFINGQFLNGAQPIAVFDQAIAAVQSGEPLVDASATAQAQPAQPAVAPTPATFTADYAYATGDEDAPVTMVEYTDYQCPYCSQYSVQTFPQIKANMIDSGRVRYIFKDLPLDSIHPLARSGAVAARCAGAQDAYLIMHDQLFADQATWTASGTIEGAKESFITYARTLELDVETFASCLNSGEFDAAIEANVAEAAALQVSSTPSFFVDGYPIAGARPYDLFDYAIGLAEAGELAQAYVQEQPQAQPTTPTGPVDVPIEEDDIVFGDPDAPVTIVEFTDFQCPYCYRHATETLPQLMSQYVDQGQVYYVIKDFPLTTIHPQAVAAAEAAHCADEQNAYLAMHETLFTTQQEWSGRSDADAVFTSYAKSLGLDETAFAECLSSDRYHTLIGNDMQVGTQVGVSGTPGFFINGIYVSGAQPYAVFEQAIQQLSAE